MTQSDGQTVYLDYAATTPIDPSVVDVMSQAMDMTGVFANPGSVMHCYGRDAATMVTEARALIAGSIGAHPEQIILTSGATEANNLALLGVLRQKAQQGKKHVITQETEHKAVLDVCRAWEKEGGELTILPVDASGGVDHQALSLAIRPDTALVSIMWVNNETGRLQDVELIGNICREKGVLFHTDAAQAVGKVRMDLSKMPIDLLSMTAGKIYGPKGIGAMFCRDVKRIRLKPLMSGGGQEGGLRPGTLPNHQIVGMAKAFELANARFDQDVEHMDGLRRQLWQGISGLPGLYLNTDFESSAPHVLSFSVGGIEGEALLLGLERIAIASGSACSTGHLKPSHVIMAMRDDSEIAHSTLRVSVGRYSTSAEIEVAILDITSTINRLRSVSAIWDESGNV